MDGFDLLDPFERLLDDVVTPGAVRAVQAGGSPAAMWSAFEESGFLDALVAEDLGGAGLSLADVAPLIQALGARAAPVPVAETMVARALLAASGRERPAGAVVLATAAAGGTGPVPMALLAEYALVEVDGAITLVRVGDARVEPTGVHHDLGASLSLPEGALAAGFQAPAAGLRALSAVLHSVAIAGAADRLLQMSVAYANERTQFGKAIGRQQVIQQQLAIMAEQVVAARLAAQIGCAGHLSPTPEAAAVAKISASVAATQVANIAHAVHGAIGISEEYDLQLLTRHLHSLRLADGSESYWSNLLGQQRIASAAMPSVDFVRARLES